MGETLKHRGPDGTQTAVLPHAALGVNRLRIVDRLPRADQPFVHAERRTWLALNGEIYNSNDLRKEFARYPFCSESDAEVVLPLYFARGAEGIADLNGMFAIAIWDEERRRLVLARDRAGEKPLFYADLHGEIVFGSEVQSLLEHPDISRDLDQEALEDYLTFGYVREPRTMFAGIRKVEAGTVVTFEASTRLTSPLSPLPTGEGESYDVATLRTQLEASVRKQLVADVPVGVFLSGGLDSSLIAAIAAREGPLNTFTVRFAESSYDEGESARHVSQFLKTAHTEMIADERGLRSAFDSITSRVAEPIADPAILPTYLLAAKARQHVGVVLSGEGADELFGGYPTYLGHKLAPWIPGWVRPLARLLPSSSGRLPLSFLLRRLVEHAHRPWLERHVAWFGTGLQGGVRSPGFGARENGLQAGTPPIGSWATLADPKTRNPNSDVLAEAMSFDYRTYLRDGLLPKIDRATMLVSLEARAPYLDRDVTAFAFGLPSSAKVRGLTTKWLLKRTAQDWLPKSVIGRRKQGLSVPISGLINGALRTEVDRLLSPGRLERQGLFNAKAAGQLLQEHRAGNHGLARGIWALVVLQRWMEEWC